MPKDKNDDTSFAQNPYYSIPQCPQFMESSFILKLTDASKNLFDLGSPGQGYVGLVDLVTGSIHLAPAFNKNDGLLRLDKNKRPFTKVVVSDGILGQLTGDLHHKACQILGLSATSKNPEGKSGRFGKVLGFGIWKGGYGIKFLDTIPLNSGLIANEYLVIKQKDRFVVYYIDEERVINPIRSEDLDITPYLSISQTIDHLSLQNQKKIESVIRAYHIKNYVIDSKQNTAIKWIKNRSTSQNAFAIKYMPEYSHWFFAKNRGHTNHVNDLIRELPLPVLDKILSAVTQGLKIAPISMLNSEDFEKSYFPGDVDGIRSHLQLELEWIVDKAQTILEYGFITSNRKLILKALVNGALLSHSCWSLVCFASEESNRRHIVNQLVYFSQCNLNDNDDSAALLQAFQWILHEPLSDDCKAMFVNAMQQLELANSLNRKLVAALKNKDSQEALIQLKAGANPNVMVSGETAFELALENDLKQVVNTMLKMNLFPNILHDGLIFLIQTQKTDDLALIKRIFQRFNQVYFLNKNFELSQNYDFNSSLHVAKKNAMVSLSKEKLIVGFDILNTTMAPNCKYPIALESLEEVDYIFQKLFMKSVALSFQFLNLMPWELKKSYLNQLLNKTNYLRQFSVIESSKLKNPSNQSDAVIISSKELWRNLYPIFNEPLHESDGIFLEAINMIGCSNDLLFGNGVHVSYLEGQFNVYMECKITLAIYHTVANRYAKHPHHLVASAGKAMLHLASIFEEEQVIEKFVTTPIATLLLKFGSIATKAPTQSPSSLCQDSRVSNSIV